MSCTPFCNARLPLGSSFPAAEGSNTPHVAAWEFPAAEGGKKGTRPPRAKILHPGNGVNLASCAKAAGTAENFAQQAGLHAAG